MCDGQYRSASGRRITEDDIADARDEAARERYERARTYRNMLAHFRGEPPEYEEDEDEEDE